MKTKVKVPMGGRIVSVDGDKHYRYYVIHYPAKSRSVCRGKEKRRTYKMVKFPHLYFYLRIAKPTLPYYKKSVLINFSVWASRQATDNLETLTPLNFSNVVSSNGSVCLGKDFSAMRDETIIRNAIERFWQTPFTQIVVNNAHPRSHSRIKLTSKGIVVRNDI